MARERDPNRDKAYQIWLEHKGNITNRRIAETLGVNEKKVAVWKQRDQWGKQSGCVVQQKKKGKKNVVQRKAGAPKGNKNAVNHGAPKGNKNNEKHGFFAKIFPDDPDVRNIVEHIGEQIQNPLDILWDQIVIQYTAIARAQKLMYVRDQDDIKKHLKKVQTGKVNMKEWEFQYPWDRHANFLQAQARAISALLSTIEKYQKMLPKTLENEEQRLKVDKLKAEINNLNNTGNEDADDWVKAIQEVAERRKAQVKANEQ